VEACIKSWYSHINDAENFYIIDNIFDTSTKNLFELIAGNISHVPKLINNTYRQANGALGGFWGIISNPAFPPQSIIPFDLASLQSIDQEATLIVYPG